MIVDVLCAVTPESLGRRLCDARLGCRATFAGPSPDDLASSLSVSSPDLVVVSPDRIATEPIRDWIRGIRGRPEHPDVVLILDREDPHFRAEVLSAGALAVLNAAVAPETLEGAFRALVERRRDHQRLTARAGAPPSDLGLHDVVSRSPRMREFVALVRRVVSADSSLLLLGETGTGKERIARAIHADGPRAAGPFVPVNCGAIPESLLESELFGHERGAFTGAIRARKGYFEQAHTGTVFLDEIGELPVHLQVKLLRVIENREVRRVGAERSFPVDVRVMAATNRELERDVREGRFRRDLYYRLAVVTLSLPPLRDRREDIPDLCRLYLDRFRRSLNRAVDEIDDDAMAALTAYPWPGNVRELINVMERATLLASGSRIGIADLPAAIAGREVPVVPTSPDEPPSALPEAWANRPLPAARREAILAFERDYLTGVLRAARGRIGRAADLAGIDERSLYDAMKRHGLRKEDFRS